VGDAGDASGRLAELLALAAGDLGSLREAIDKLDREDAGGLLLAAVLRVASLEAPALAVEADERDANESQAGGAEELPVEDPFVDPAAPYAAMLDAGRQLRLALLDQPDLPALLNALGALTADENALVVLEYALDAFWARRLEGGADGERGDGGDG
jgi:hypothetical protein